MPESPDHTENDLLDVAVIGGGISGVYSAWRLREEGASSDVLQSLCEARDDNRLRVGLFEYSSRIGGRLYSAKAPGVEDTPVELGGMRFLNSHLRVVALTKKFRLKTEKLEVNDPNGNNLYYLRGKHFRHADWGRPSFHPPYKLDRGERARSPGEMVIETVLRNLERAPHLKDTGFWNLLLEEWGDEAYRLIREGAGYDSIVNNWSAAEAIPFLLADFPTNAAYFRIQSGFQSLPVAIWNRFIQAGGEPYLQHRLHRLDRTESGLIRLTFDKIDDEAAHDFRYFRRVLCPRHVLARHVILAMPRRAIETLHPDSFVFSDNQFQDALETVLPQAAFKIFAAYRRPWWNKTRGIEQGRSVTDLPIRQCYYWRTKPDDCSVLMASYNDGASVEFWSGLLKQQKRYAPPHYACPPGIPVPDHTGGIRAPEALVRELQNQLRELHGLADLPGRDAPIIPPYWVVFQDWTQAPYGGGWHFWKINSSPADVIEYLRKPFPDAPLYICGEAWSKQQGWVEGALETADGVLEHSLHMPAALF